MERFKTLKNGYKFDRRIFTICSWIIVITTIALLARYGFGEEIYYHCPAETLGYCINPFLDQFGDCSVDDKLLCQQEAFPPGFEYGSKPGWLMSNIVLLFFGVLIVGFVINHFQHNERWAR